MKRNNRSRSGGAAAVARWAAAFAALLAAAAAVAAAPALVAAEPDVLMVEVWRAVGFATFAALFALLAVRPHLSIALWSIVLGNKIALTVVGLVLGTDIPGATSAAAWDGVLVAILSAGLVAAVISRRRSAVGAAGHGSARSKSAAGAA